ncbi:MAG: acetate--CoA ligase family protein [Thermodesulfobacteriota bacterium]
MNIRELIEKAKRSGAGSLNEHESKIVLKAYDVPVVEEISAADAETAVQTAEKIGFPVVLKGMGAALSHKTEQGLVHLNLTDSEGIRSAARSITASAGEDLEGFLVQPLVKGRREFVAGLFRDDQFGPIVMFGIGGIFTEAIKDVTFRLAPLTESDAEEMLDEIRAKALLGPFRGEPAVDRGGLIRTLIGLSKIALEHPEIAEIDINPLLAAPTGEVQAVDALVVIRETGAERRFPPALDPKKLGNFFHPRSIAFVGASSQLGKWGHNLFTITAAHGYEGEIYLVNPKGGTIAGRDVFQSVGEIPGSVDLAIVTIPAKGVMGLIPQFQDKGIKNMLLITSGFGETGEKGRELERKLVDTAREAGILILGPNTMGICNPHIQLYCTGSHVWPEPGSTAVVAQSGNMGTQLLAFAEQQRIGVRCFAGSGNEAMVTIEDFLDAFEVDSVTRNIMLYVESVKNGRRFFETARRVGRKKPVVLMKGGRSGAGNRAAASHTGAMSSDVRVFEAVCRQAGIVTADYPMDLLDLSAAFSSLPLPKGNRAAIMTLGGGWGVVTADLCAEFGLAVPELAPEIVSRIDKVLPPYWSRSNPVDIVGEHSNEVAISVLQELMEWEGCDAVINLGLVGRKDLLGRIIDSAHKSDPNYTVEFTDSVKAQFADFEVKYLEFITELMEKHQKPVYGVSISFEGDGRTIYHVEGKECNGVFYPTPERAVKAFAKMHEYNRFLAR